MSTPSADAPLLTLENVSKSFGPVRVIDDVTVHVRRGHVQVLLGENGAGKSTLIKMMSGIYQPDGGRILVDGGPVVLDGVRAAESHGIATIHQELNLVPTMSVAENVLMGRLPSRAGLLDKRAMRTTARRALDRIGLDVDVDQPVGELGVARQQLVEIAKALSLDARMLILDEPTAALTHGEIDALFGVVEDLRADGVGMVFISHHLEEIARIGDDVSVLRDGSLVAEVPASTDEDELVRHMVGRDIADHHPRRREYTGPDEVLLDVQHLSRHGVVDDISFQVRAGEVLGIAGLVGAGRTELLRAVAGADPYDAGTVTVRGGALPAKDVGSAIAAGVGHVPEDRKSQGLVLGASVNENIGYATLRSTARLGLVDRPGQRRRAQDVADRLRIRMRDIDQTARDLSGGNQQKIVFARWVLAGSQVLLLDEPTRGVDVGARVEIYEFINAITADGGAVVMVSSDLPEVLGMSDRILVMSGGHVAGELEGEDATEDRVMALAVRDVDRDAEDHSEGTSA
ncbi:sugar ABC transporter ATP-binding protein [Isoptericola halotolerans]|uniref:Ribose transport system ATP-binding protein n=1 Tax=Isoptericola halotolerans TaxID=300560 RepID=A0ABX1ZYC8_9MICO|nr:sugar ABC transporter ATP-binding protein [Isoptericola halotolerans]NOV95481.1 ribose transport system ATP-binding protein [Isoptericola halotolerans]